MDLKNFSLKKLAVKSLKVFLIILYLTFVIALSFGPVVAGIMTLLPAESFGWEVSKPSHLGYYSVCSFAPYSTLILFGMSVVGFILLLKFGKYLVRKSKKSVLYLKYKALVNKN